MAWKPLNAGLLASLVLAAALVLASFAASPAAAAEAEAHAAAKLRAKTLLLSFSIRGMLHSMGVVNVSDPAEIQARLGVNASLAEALASAASLDARAVSSMSPGELEETVSRLERLHRILRSMLAERAGRALAEELRVRKMVEVYTRLADIAERTAKSLNDTRLAELARKLRDALHRNDLRGAAAIAAEIRAELQLARLEAVVRTLNNATTVAVLNPAAVERLKKSLHLLEKLLERMSLPPAVNETIAVEKVARVAVMLNNLNMSIGVVGDAASTGNTTAALEAWLTLLQNRLEELAAKLPAHAAEKLEYVNETLREAAEALADGDLREAAKLLARAHYMITVLEEQASVEIAHEMKIRHLMPELRKPKRLAELLRHVHMVYENKTLERIMDKLEELEDKVSSIIEETKELIQRLRAEETLSPAAERLLERAELFNSQAEAHYKAALEAKAAGNIAGYAAELRISFTLAVKANAMAKAAAAASGHTSIIDKLRHGLGKLKNETLGKLPWGGKDGKKHGGGKHSEENQSNNTMENNATLAAAINEALANTSSRLKELRSIASSLAAVGVEEAEEYRNTIDSLLERIQSIARAVAAGRASKDKLAEAAALEKSVHRLEQRIAATLLHVARAEASSAQSLRAALTLQFNSSAAVKAGSIIAGAEEKVNRAVALLSEYSETHDLRRLAEAARLLIDARRDLRLAAKLLGLGPGEPVEEAVEKTIEDVNNSIEELRGRIAEARRLAEELRDIAGNCSGYIAQALEGLEEAEAQLGVAARLTVSAEASLDEGNVAAASKLAAEAKANVSAARSLVSHAHRDLVKAVQCMRSEMLRELAALEQNMTRIKAEIARLRAAYSGNATAQLLLGEAEEALQRAELNASKARALLQSASAGKEGFSAEAEIIVEAHVHIEAARVNVDIAASLVASLKAGAGGGQGGGEEIPSPPSPPGHGG